MSMTDKKRGAKKLSQGVLELKFMKKSKEKAQIEEENDERELLYQDQLAALQDNVERVVLLNSHYDMMTYLPCRLSFGGMEPGIEKLNAPKLKGLYEVPKEEKTIEENDVDVTDAEMASHYSSLNENLTKKFNNKRPTPSEFIPPYKRKKPFLFKNPEDNES